MRPTWIEYARKLAEVAATRSEDPHKKVGAVVLRHDNSIASIGYNGAPSGVEIDWSNRDERRLRVVHAEVNALRYCRPGECSYIVSTLMPCVNCLSVIASYGIKQIYYVEEYMHDGRSATIAEEFGITLTKI